MMQVLPQVFGPLAPKNPESFDVTGDGGRTAKGSPRQSAGTLARILAAVLRSA